MNASIAGLLFCVNNNFIANSVMDVNPRTCNVGTQVPFVVQGEWGGGGGGTIIYLGELITVRYIFFNFKPETVIARKHDAVLITGGSHNLFV